MKDRPPLPHPKPHRTATPSGVEFASGLAIEALTYLAGQPERLDRFLALSGLDHGSLRAAAQEPGFLAAVLDHVASDESLLLAFASECGHPPEQIGSARECLSGPSGWTEP
ncbi:MAG: hypothetical protein JWM36_2060 [Hyphomicrobiales bacterium]|nr:hypothetical protein [Hyphomicrobiales bacterium]